jgi:DNA-binding transcriptional LysR family regulator
MVIDPRRLLTFRAVAEAGSFSRAAEALALTQPAVSQQVAGLERQLGARLLDRGPGGPVPTPVGAVLLEHARAIAQRLDLAGAQLDELTAPGPVRLRVGAFASALGILVAPAIARLRGALPDLEIAATEGRSDELGERTGRGELHAAICFQDPAAPPREPGGTVRRELGDEPMLVALAPGHRLAGEGRIRLEDLAGDVWTAPSTSGLVRRACAAAGFEPRVAFVTPDPLAIRALVAGGLAVTLVPRLLTADLPGVVVRELAGEPPRRTLYALTAEAGAPAAAGAFVDAIAEALRASSDRPTA